LILLKGGLHGINIINRQGIVIKSYSLDLCNGPDLFWLEFEPQLLRHEYIDYSVNSRGLPGYWQEFNGWRVKVGLDYSTQARDVLTAMIGAIMDYQETNLYTYEFYPFANDLTFHFPMINDVDSLKMVELPNEGYEGLYLRFVSSGVIMKLNLFTQAQLAVTYIGHLIPRSGKLQT
jgi:hypothetical protein